MLKVLYLFFAFVLSQTAIFAQKTDEQIIADLLNEESQAFTELPMDEIVQKFWKVDENSSMTITLKNGKTIYRDKDKILATKRKVVMEPVHTENTDVFVRIVGDMAFSSHEEVLTNKETGAKSYSHQLHVWLKVDGAWKVNISNIHQYSRD
jgi:hypothetical protein